MDAILSRSRNENNVITWLDENTTGEDIASSTQINGSATNAKLAVRLAQAIVTKNTTPKVSETDSTNKDALANIVKQVIGQDASRAMDQDNNQLDPGARQPLRFIAGDTIVVNIKLTKPDVTIDSTANKVTKSTLEGKFQSSEQTSYSVVIELE